jgi:hypothetical protein
MKAKESVMDLKDCISLVDLAARFAKAKGMAECGYEWQRIAPGRGVDKNTKVGNSLAVLKAIRSFNSTNSKPIQVFNTTGYDGTPKQMMVINKDEVIRLKGYILRGKSKHAAKRKSAAPFKILGEVEV